MTSPSSVVGGRPRARAAAPASHHQRVVAPGLERVGNAGEEAASPRGRRADALPCTGSGARSIGAAEGRARAPGGPGTRRAPGVAGGSASSRSTKHAGVLGPAGPGRQDHRRRPAFDELAPAPASFGRPRSRARSSRPAAPGCRRSCRSDRRPGPSCRLLLEPGATARQQRARALPWSRASSRSGSESATMPAPVWTCAVPSCTITVRMVMQKSRSPENVR